MTVSTMLCNLLVVSIFLMVEFSEQTKLVANSTLHSKSNIGIFTNRFIELMLNIKVTYTLGEHVQILLPHINKDQSEALDLLLQKMHKSSNRFVATVRDSHDCSVLEEEKIPYHQMLIIYHYPAFYVIPILQRQALACFNDQLEQLGRTLDFNPRAVFIILIFQDKGTRLDGMNSKYSGILNILWSKNLFSSVLLVVTNWELIMFTAKPFSTVNQCRKIQINGIKYHKLATGLKDVLIDLYQEELVMSYNGCVFVAGTFPIPPYVIGSPVTVNGQTHYKYKNGIEIKLLQLLASVTNFTIEFSKTRSYSSDAVFSMLPNGSIVGTLHDVVMHRIDTTFGGLAPSYISYYKFDYVFSYKVSSISFFLVDSGPIPHWKIFFIVFDVEVWILSLSLFVIVGVVYCALDRLGRSRRGRMLREIVFLELLEMNVGFSSTLRPSRCSLKILFVSWAVYSVHWGLAYTTVLVSLQTHTPQDSEITNLAELHQAGLQVRVDELHRGLFANLNLDATSASLLSRSVTCEPAACLQDLLAHRNISLMTKAEAVEYSVDMQRLGVHKLPENMLTFFVAFSLSKGNPLSARLSRLSHRAVEVGLTQRWDRNTRQTLGSAYLRPDHTHTALSLDDLRGAFTMLAYGLSIAALVFLAEILYNWKM